MGTQGTVLQGHRRPSVFALAMAIVLTAAIAVLAAQAATLRSGTRPATAEVSDWSDGFVGHHGLAGGHRVNGEPHRYDHWVRNPDGTYTYYRYAGDPGGDIRYRGSSQLSRKQPKADNSGP